MNLSDSLLEAARYRARQEGRTVTSLMEEALWSWLAKNDVRHEVSVLPTDGHPDGHFLVDIDDKDALAAVLDTDELR